METNRWKQLYYIKDVSDISIDLSGSHLFETMKNIEKAHWDYLDNYSSVSTFYPKMNIFSFMEDLFKYKGMTNEISRIRDYVRRYDKYKKTIPTAGVVLTHKDQVLLVRVHGSPLYCLPKGKYDACDGDLQETAIRETMEETGVDVRDVITTAQYITVLRTRFYLIKSDELIKSFSGYNKNEIKDIRWVKFSYIQSNPTEFSKQVRAVMLHLNLTEDSE